jgi:glycosyltransferase involved in cell wall biosynthesis
MAQRNLLLVSYQFPPIGGSGVQRVLKLARYLPRAGWRPQVLTADHAHYPLIDSTLVPGLGDQAVVHRVCGLEPAGLARMISRQLGLQGTLSDRPGSFEDRLYWRMDRLWGRLPLPETEMLWAPAAIGLGRRLIRDRALEAVVTTSPPYAAHLVGLALKRRLRLPWIADLRDPILDNFSYHPNTRSAARFWQWLERTVVHNADHTVVTCPELRERFLQRYPDLDAGRVSTITNGFDPSDCPALVDPPQVRRQDKERFTLAYVGAFYAHQTIGPVLEAIRILRASRQDIAEHLEFRLIGSLSASQRRLLRGADAAFLDNLGYCPHQKAVAEMAQADALLLVTPSNEGGRFCIPAKTFEYLAFGRHIIALVHEGTALAGILTQAGNVSLVHRHESAALAQTLERCYDAWRAGTLEGSRNRGVVDRFRRDRLAARFAQVVQHCTDGSPILQVCREDLELEEEAA